MVHPASKLFISTITTMLLNIVSQTLLIISMHIYIL